MKTLMRRIALLCLFASASFAQLITAQSAGSLTSSGATIAWTTCDVSDSQVSYGLTSAYGSQSTLDASAVTFHSVALTGLSPSTIYHYQVTSIDAAGDVLTSPDGTFTTSGVTAAITTNPSNTTTCAGSTVTLLSAASGSPAPTAQWKLSTDGGTVYNNITGATSANYSFTALASQTGYKYKVTYTNSGGSVTSTVATLTVNTVPVITTQPLNKSVTAGTNATFTIADSGTPSPTIQWQVSTDGGTSWTNVASATSTTLTVTAPTIGQNGSKYRAAVSNSCATVYSSVVTLTVTSAQTYSLSYSSGSDRSSGAFLQGATLSGSKYLWTSLLSSATTSNVTGATNVCFYLDNAAPTTLLTTQIPTQIDSGEIDTQGLELGVNYTSSVSGQLTAIRFYKAAGNTGTHVGSVWNTSGTRLASVTFTGESASGWQEQALSTPLSLQANTAYIVSYHLQVGHYSVTPSVFINPPGANISNGPLKATAGEYIYGGVGVSQFPTAASSSNYFVDAKFVATSAAPVTCDSLVPYDFFGSSPAVAAFVQIKTAGSASNSVSSLPVTFNSSQGAGNLNAIAVGWYGPSANVSATDTRGNTYSVAVAPQQQSVNTTWHAILYAKNIGAGANTVTVTFSAPVNAPDIRAVEYSGLDHGTPLDQTASAVGAGTAAASGAKTTMSASEIVFGAGNSAGAFTAAGSGFNQRAITTIGGMLAEDRLASAMGSYNATGATTRDWVMQMATFRPATVVKAWDTTKVPNGTHAITQVVTLSSGATETDSATFTVTNTVAHHMDLAWVKGTASNPVTYNVYRANGACVSTPAWTRIQTGLSSPSFIDNSISNAASTTNYCYSTSQTDSLTAQESPKSNFVTGVVP